MPECFSCKGIYPKIDGPTHRYMDSSPGCWQIYGEILSKEYSSQNYWKNHRLTVDAYAAQHPGIESSQSIQSVAVHLLSLYFIMEEGRSHNEARELIGKATTHKFQWLTPPDDLGGISAKNVWMAESAKEHNDMVELWAESVWFAWEMHHKTIQKWARQIVETVPSP